jgi:bifunctional UDP-N-acetylglucosamine pyrophosphorylase/glucosamine-1-phosphate N-acetyltransferase
VQNNITSLFSLQFKTAVRQGTRCRLPAWKPNEGDLLVLSGDVPCISSQTLRRLLDQHTQSGASATLLSTKLEDGAEYGRVVRSTAGDVERIVEHKDATDEQRRIPEINTGIYCFAIADLAQIIDELSAKNSQKEYYLTDCIALLRKQNKLVGAVICEDRSEVSGVNSRVELAELSVVRQKLKELMQDGDSTIIDPASTYGKLQIGADSVLYPNVFLEKGTVIGAGCLIYPNVRISASRIEDGVVVFDSCLISESIWAGVVGPFAHLKSHCHRKPGRIGNLSNLRGSGTKQRRPPELLGDAETGCERRSRHHHCNYDGVKQEQAIIEDGVSSGVISTDRTRHDSQCIHRCGLHHSTGRPGRRACHCAVAASQQRTLGQEEARIPA